jgi:hypothetical protein|tara:strand:- start:240 stop:608 length:369 start_codon:yes stop_codon:yes gene_type:complete
MAFKLGSKRGNTDNKLNIGGKSNVIGGVKVEFADLDEGVMGEAHKEGLIYINSNIEKDSEQYNRVLQHEMKHIVHMKLGRVDYDDNWVYWDGQYYPRKDGYVEYKGEMYPEGDINLPWEFKD